MRDLPDLLGDSKPATSQSVSVRGTSLSRSVEEIFPGASPVVSPRQRAARLIIQCPLLSITAVSRDRLKPVSVRGETRPVTVDWSQLVVGGRPGIRLRQRRTARIHKIPSYVNIFMSCP